MGIGEFFGKIRDKLSCKRSVDTRESSSPKKYKGGGGGTNGGTNGGTSATTPSSSRASPHHETKPSVYSPQRSSHEGLNDGLLRNRDAPWAEVDTRAVGNIFGSNDVRKSKYSKLKQSSKDTDQPENKNATKYHQSDRGSDAGKGMDRDVSQASTRLD